MKHLVNRNNKEMSAYLCDKQIECSTFNIIHHHPTTENNDSDKDVLLHWGRNKKMLDATLRFSLVKPLGYDYTVRFIAPILLH